MARSSLPLATLLAAAIVSACGGLSAGLDFDGGNSSSGTEGETDAAPIECQPSSVPTLDEPGTRVLERIATADQIPGLAEQPSTHGRILGSLHAFDGRLHLGYGDYSDNTGPITMSAWDPGEGAFVSLGVLPTEEVLWFRPGPGVLYSPSIDPTGHQAEGGVFRLECGASTWQEGAAIEGAVHVYDVAVHDETIYAGTGSLSGRPARLMESHDRGESWTEVLRHESPGDRFSRFYFVAATGTELFVSGQEHPDPDLTLAWLRRGDGDFVPLRDPPPHLLVPIVLGQRMVVAAFSSNPGRGTALSTHRIDGDRFVPDQPWPTLGEEVPTLVAWAAQPANAGHPERLLVLLRAADGTSLLARTDDLALGSGGWESLMTLDPPGGTDEHVSMALLLGDLYLGTREGALDVVRQLDAPAQ